MFKHEVALGNFLFLILMASCSSHKFSKNDCLTIDVKNEPFKTFKPYYRVVDVNDSDYEIETLPSTALKFHTESIQSVEHYYRKVECVPDELLELPPDKKNEEEES